MRESATIDRHLKKIKRRVQKMVISPKEKESKEIEIVVNVWGPSNSYLHALFVLPLNIRNKVR